MRVGFLLFLFLVSLFSSLHAQEYVLKVRKKEKESDFYPHISGVMNGDISLEAVCGNEITNNKEWKVISFVISYGFKHIENPMLIEGSYIPKSLCDNWKSINYKGIPIFITEIQAIDENGHVFRLNNLKLILK